VSQLALTLNGPTMAPADFARTAKQRAIVLAYMADGGWHTLAEIARHTGYPEASVSARLRDFRKPQYGSHAVDRRRKYGDDMGTHEYRLTLRNQ
jgi:hypothetical protein